VQAAHQHVVDEGLRRLRSEGSSVSLSRSVATRAGALSGRPARRAKKSRGCGSKVSTLAGMPRCRASLRSNASIA
jgi:hypothetical protein